MSIQLDLDGEPINTDIEFNCPLCDKPIILKRDDKGNIYHRPWTFHFMYDHINKSGDRWRSIKGSLNYWFKLFMFHDTPLAEELMQEWREKVDLGRTP